MLKKVDVPEGTAGQWEIRRFEVTKEDADFHRMRCAIRGRMHRVVTPGTYTRLTHNGSVIMSDTPVEMRGHEDAYRRAEGHVLVNGLGLGMYVDNILDKREVERVTVVEISQDVIGLVEPHLREKHGSSRLDILCGDAYTYRWPVGQTFDYAWHDIWPDICEDNLKGMERLHRRYGRRVKGQGSWSRGELERMRKRDRRARGVRSFGWR
jgi:hypothetical protein